MHRLNKTRIAVQALLLVAISALSSILQADEPISREREPRFRGPVALVLLDDGKLLLTANRRSGSISVIDAESGLVTDEVPVGKKLSDLVAAPGRDLLLATDEEAHEVILMSRAGRRLTVIARAPIAPYPVSITVSRDQARCWVASLWSRRLSAVDLVNAPGGEQPNRLKISKVL